jgi:hypothetical protein
MFDVNEWWHVLTNGKEFVGKADGKKLSDVQECITQTGIVQDAQGRARPHKVVMTFPARVRTLDIPVGALWISIAAYNDKNEWAKTIESTERLALEQRAQESGLQIVRGH